MQSSESTLALVALAQAGDENAKNKLITDNSPLVKSVIKRFLGKGIEYDDLYQLGCLGFVKAINNFDTKFNVKFSTYVVPMVIGEIKRFMRDDGAIKVSRSIKSTNIKINKFIAGYEEEHNERPSIDEIAKQFEIDSQEVVFIMDSARMPLSIYAPFQGGGDASSKRELMVDRFAFADASEELMDNIVLKEALKDLSPRDKQIILLRFFRDKTQSDIARILNVSQVQVSRLENKILEKLKEKMLS